ncbi:MAG: hypothetical protein ACOX0C_00045 [Patescibacteria group bacterium]
MYPSAIITILPDDPSWLAKSLMDRNSQSIEEIKKRTDTLEEYTSELKALKCNFVYTNYSEKSWDKTFKEIERIIFKKS